MLVCAIVACLLAGYLLLTFPGTRFELGTTVPVWYPNSAIPCTTFLDSLRRPAATVCDALESPNWDGGVTCIREPSCSSLQPRSCKFDAAGFQLPVAFDRTWPQILQSEGVIAIPLLHTTNAGEKLLADLGDNNCQYIAGSLIDLACNMKTSLISPFPYYILTPLRFVP